MNIYINLKQYSLIYILLLAILSSCQYDNTIITNNKLKFGTQEGNKNTIISKKKSTDCADCEKLIKAYPDFIIGAKENYIIWKDGSKMIFDDGKQKEFSDLLNNADIQDMFTYKYDTENNTAPDVNYDPGRIRNETFFKKMYGKTKLEVAKNLVTIIWLPKTLNKKIRVSNINNIAKKIQTISNILDTMPHLHKYVNNIGGTYNWRKISGTNRLSAHSFGIAIDINVNHSNYWKWAKSKKKIIYKNKIPIEIVKIFEKYGFIWGGRWYHYDTMHFEYRPELF